VFEVQELTPLWQFPLNFGNRIDPGKIREKEISEDYKNEEKKKRSSPFISQTTNELILGVLSLLSGTHYPGDDKHHRVFERNPNVVAELNNAIHTDGKL
jgi:hypothetical protein